MFIVRLTLFVLFFYLVYFLVKNLFGSKKTNHKAPGSGSSGREGDVSISYDPRRTQDKAAGGVGDYIDYEEIDEDKKRDKDSPS